MDKRNNKYGDNDFKVFTMMIITKTCGYNQKMDRQDTPSQRTTARQRKIRKVIENRQEGVIVLENIADPHNAGAVWRTADAFGFQKIYMVYSKEKPINPKKIGKASSSSANKWLSFKIFDSIEKCYTELKKDGFKIYATVLDKEAKSLQSTIFNLQSSIFNLQSSRTAVVFGNEHRGLSDEAIKGADEKIYIPMKGMVQSLNISVTAGIVMYELDRQRRKNPPLTPPLTGRGEKFSNKNCFTLDKKEREKLEKEMKQKGEVK